MILTDSKMRHVVRGAAGLRYESFAPLLYALRGHSGDRRLILLCHQTIRSRTSSANRAPSACAVLFPVCHHPADAEERGAFARTQILVCRLSNTEIREAEKNAKTMRAVIHSMTVEERSKPELLTSSPSRRRRIAKGCGKSERQVRWCRIRSYRVLEQVTVIHRKWLC